MDENMEYWLDYFDWDDEDLDEVRDTYIDTEQLVRLSSIESERLARAIGM